MPSLYSGTTTTRTGLTSLSGGSTAGQSRADRSAAVSMERLLGDKRAGEISGRISAADTLGQGGAPESGKRCASALAAALGVRRFVCRRMRRLRAGRPPGQGTLDGPRLR